MENSSQASRDILWTISPGHAVILEPKPKKMLKLHRIRNKFPKKKKMT